jgi:anti-sigma factor RsiW
MLLGDAIAARPSRQRPGESIRATVRLGRRAALATLTIGAAVALAASANADADVDVDANFADQLHRHNIYGSRDYDALAR